MEIEDRLRQLESQIKELEDRLERAVDLERVKQLKYAHAQLIDLQDPEAIAAHFTDDAIWERGPGDIHKGSAAVRDRMAESFMHMKWSQHNVSAVVVELDASGTGAHGEWDEIECFDWDGRSLMVGTHQSDRYVKVSGEWKFAENRVRIVFGPVVLATDSNSAEDLGLTRSETGRAGMPQSGH